MGLHSFDFHQLSWLNVFSDFSTVMNKLPSVVLALLGMFFWPELLQYVVQMLCPFLRHLGIPKCWRNWQLPTYGRCKIFLHQPGKIEQTIEPEQRFLLFLFVYSCKYWLDVLAQVMFWKNNPNFLGYIQAMFVLQILWICVFLPLGPNNLTTFQQNSQSGLALLVWSCLLPFLWLSTIDQMMFVPDKDRKQKGALICYVRLLRNHSRLE